MVRDGQVRRLCRELSLGRPLWLAAAKAGMDEKTARKWRGSTMLPSQCAVRHTWRTRADPFEEVWSAVAEQLSQNPDLQAKTLLGWLQREYPGRFADGQLRTLQRRVKSWRATAGPRKEVFFSQVHHPGRLAASDFTHMTSLLITIAGTPFDHLLYHFVLTYSNWETVRICFSESFESFSEGLQSALWELGGVPERHRTDRLSAAINNLSEEREFTRRHEALLSHYGLTGERTQANHGNENGDVEQRHHRFKVALDQALMLRGSRDFPTRDAYERFLRELTDQLNAGRRDRFEEERALLKRLPKERLSGSQRVRVRVDTGSLIHVLRNTYSVDSRLIGEMVDVWVDAEHLEVWYAQKKIETLPRLRGRGKHRVSYRHVIDSLVRKPGAFENYRYREELFPTSRFRLAYDELRAKRPASATKEYLKVLELSAKESQSAVDTALTDLLAQDQAISFEGVEALVLSPREPTSMVEVDVKEADLSAFDELLDDKEVDHDAGCEDGTDRWLEGIAPADVSGGV